VGKSKKRAWRDAVEGKRHLKNKNYTKFNELEIKKTANDILKNSGRKAV
jgi:hypothetical protein